LLIVAQIGSVVNSFVGFLICYWQSTPGTDKNHGKSSCHGGLNAAVRDFLENAVEVLREVWYNGGIIERTAELCT
jgi:hypothetical protein